MKELKNLSNFNEFLLEATNTYQVKNNEKIFGTTGNYKDTLKIFKQAIEEGSEGDEISMIKVKDNKGKEVNVVSKVKTIGGGPAKKPASTKKPVKQISSTSKSVKLEQSDINTFKKAIKDQLFDLFEPAPKNVKYENDSDGKPISVTFSINAKDCVNKINPDETLKNFSFGVSKKKPYLVSVGNVEVDSDVLEKAKKAVTDNASNIDKDRTYKVSYPISYKNNPKFGKEMEEMEREFTKDSSQQLKNKLKSDKYSESQKDEMKEVLKERGIKSKSEFDEDYKTDADDEKEALAAAKKE